MVFDRNQFITRNYINKYTKYSRLDKKCPRVRNCRVIRQSTFSALRISSCVRTCKTYCDDSDNQVVEIELYNSNDC